VIGREIWGYGVISVLVLMARTGRVRSVGAWTLGAGAGGDDGAGGGGDNALPRRGRAGRSEKNSSATSKLGKRICPALSNKVSSSV